MQNIKPFNNYHLIITTAFTVLLFLSIIFYKERIIFADLSFHLFELIRQGNYAIQNFRFGSIFTQSFPLAAIKAGFSLKAVMLVYSSAFIIYYYTLYFICAKVLKQYKYALVIFSMLIFAVVDTFYWTQSELPQGIAFMLLFFAVVESKNNYFSFSWKSFGAVVLLTTVVFFHPSLIFPFSFFVGFKILSSNKKENKKWKITALGYGIILIIKAIFFRTIYDRWALGGLKNFYYKFPNYIDIQSNKDFLTYLLEDYYLLLIGVLILFWFYYSKKKYKLLFLTCFYFFGYLTLTNISYADGANQFYIENLYLPLSFFLLIPLVFQVWPVYSSKKIALFIFILIVGIQLLNIYNGHTKYSERLSWLRDTLQKTKSLENNKLVIPEKDVPMDTLMITWASSYEFWLLSTVEDNRTRSAIIHKDPESLSWAMQEHKGFLTNWGIFEQNSLPTQYFNFPDSTSHYVLFNNR